MEMEPTLDILLELYSDEEIIRLFNITGRTLHSWRQGAPMMSKHRAVAIPLINAKATATDTKTIKGHSGHTYLVNDTGVVRIS